VSAPRISLVEYGGGNLRSVERAFARLGVHTDRAARPEQITESEALVLPGVGHFGAMINTLESAHLIAPIKEFIASGRLFLGICVGLQALFAVSEEAPGVAGLGMIPGQVAKLPGTVKLPHMGWNRIRRMRESSLLAGVPDDAWFYFAHSYSALAAGEATVAWCDYGVPFVAAIERDAVFAVQFHPEKSGDAGATVLANFAKIASHRLNGEAAAQRTSG